MKTKHTDQRTNRPSEPSEHQPLPKVFSSSTTKITLKDLQDFYGPNYQLSGCSPGTAKGYFEMSDDFDEPLEEFEEYM